MNIRMYRIGGFSTEFFELGKLNGATLFALGDDIVAIADYYARASEPSEQVWLLDAIEVRTDKRGWGVGRAVMERIASDVLKNGGVKLEAVASSNVSGFYEKLGMREVTRNHFEGDLGWLNRMKRGST